MRKIDRWMPWIMVALAAGFVAGLVQLFTLRFEATDVFPAYSSLRVDPLGTRALYESLDGLEAIGARRNFLGFDKLGETGNSALLLLGMYPSDKHVKMAQWQVDAIENVARKGGRVIVTFVPIVGRSDLSPALLESEGGQETTPFAGGMPSYLTKRWGFRFKFDLIQPKPFEPAVFPEATREGDDEVVPVNLTWHSSTYFDELTPEWRVIYRRDDHPVMVERAFDGGSVVLVSDGYLLSNEALTRDRQAGLIAWLIGDNTDVVFDETHLGVVEPTGFMVLVRKHRLHGLFIGLVVVGVLYVWKNALGFIPPTDDVDRHATRTDLADGRDAAAALVNLLRRTIPPSEILAACVGEWRKSNLRGARGHRPKLEKIEQVLIEEQSFPPRQRNPVGAYQRISRILKERKP
jgi:hypothetical protein